MDQIHNPTMPQSHNATRPISHNAPVCYRSVYICARFCYKIVHAGIFVWCTVEVMRWVYTRYQGISRLDTDLFMLSIPSPASH